MNQSSLSIITEAKKFATDIFKNKVSESITYHNLLHTEDVIAACEKMADYYQLSEANKTVLMTAGWFHDTGFMTGIADGHEEESAMIAVQFLKTHNQSPEFIENVRKTILATKMPQSPANLIEEILCDADLFHLGTNDFKQKNKLLRKELANTIGDGFSKKQWKKKNTQFLENHTYFTQYGKEKLQPIQYENLQRLKEQQKEEEEEKEAAQQDVPVNSMDTKTTKLNKITEQPADVKSKKDELAEKRRREQQTDRGISTVFRIMASNHANLSHMADNKAHIMISVNSIILSVVISLLIRHLDEHQSLIIPTIILVGFCVVATIFSVLATRPNVSQGTFTKEDIFHKKTNLLFFGNFHSMQLDDYDWAMKEMMADKDYLYGSIIKDIYYLGVVLAKKYKYLRASYNIFMFGLVISMIAFGIALSYESFFAPAPAPLPAIH
jgi:predicted metal-dependent HD superfamily phosphohydrolase